MTRTQTDIAAASRICGIKNTNDQGWLGRIATVAASHLWGAKRRQRIENCKFAQWLCDAPAYLRQDIGIDGGARMNVPYPEARSFVQGQALRNHLW